MRLTGKHETAPWNKFSYGVADRGASIRVPHSFVNNGYKGYLEDRRPNSQGDPYADRFADPEDDFGSADQRQGGCLSSSVVTDRNNPGHELPLLARVTAGEEVRGFRPGFALRGLSS